jgi:Pyruvate/2-oxoacid:ferredoxin oxidoreductase delta subunit
MKALSLALAALTGLATASPWTQFEQFMVDFNKKYETETELMFRFEIFKDNLIKIDQQNAAHRAIGGGDVFGINAFADMSSAEFSKRLMKDLPPREPSRAEYEWKVQAGTAVDWRQKGVVTAVKDQGQCGSCWAHSADEAVESFDAIKYGKDHLKTLSVQQCTACTYSYNGCNGGWPHDAYVYAVEDRNGIDLDSSYPYNIPTAGTCKFGAKGNADLPVADVITYASPPKGQLQTLLDNTGPVSVCVAAEQWSAYTGGILKNCPGSVDHCVQAVGYNATGAEPYWIVRNSWGTSWGVKGYIYLDMATNSGDICHIQEYMTYPTAQEG